MRPLMIAVVLVGIVCLAVANAYATCAASVPFLHGFSYFACSNATPVSAMAWQVTNPSGVNSGTANITSQAVPGDDRVIIFSDWGDPGFSGCPLSGAGPQRIAVVVRDALGQGVVLSIGGADPSLGYLVEAAHPFDVPTGQIAPLVCGSRSGQPRVVTRKTGATGDVTLTLHVEPPVVFSDCDPNSVGSVLGACLDGWQASPGPGALYTSTQPCTGRTDLRRSAWTATGVVPDANGDATITVTPPDGTECTLVGATATIGGVETGAILGFVQVLGAACGDLDGDGWTGCQGDCDDSDAARFPGKPEICDGTDNDCDGAADDGLAAVPEICDGIDNNCDGQVDNQGACSPPCQSLQKVGADVQETDDPALSWTPALVWTGTGYGVAWSDFRDGDGDFDEIYFARLSGSGAKIGDDLRETAAPFGSSSPRITWTGSGYGLVWQDMRNSISALEGHWEVYFAYLNADGVKVSDDVRVTDNASDLLSDSSEPSVTWTGSEFGIAWRGASDIYFVRLDPSGARIGSAVRVTAPPGGGLHPAIVWTGTEYGLIWVHYHDSIVDILFTRLDATGARMGPDVLVSSALNDIDAAPALIWTGSEYGIAWRDGRARNPEIFLARLTASGLKVGDDIRVTNDPGQSMNPSLVWTGSEYAVAWADDRDGNFETYLALVDGTGVKSGPDLRVTTDTAYSASPVLAWSGSEFAMTWRDSRPGNNEIFFARLACNCIDRDGDGFPSCVESDDTRAAVHPGAVEVCDGLDNDGDGLVDEDPSGVDSDGDGVHNACDNCDSVANIGQTDADRDGVGDACDSCPSISNPDQNPEACSQRVEPITITFSNSIGRGSGTVAWTTSHEVDVRGYNVVVFDAQGRSVQQNPALIPCEECVTGMPNGYVFVVPKHKSGRDVYIELVRRNGIIDLWGPATRP